MQPTENFPGKPDIYMNTHEDYKSIQEGSSAYNY